MATTRAEVLQISGKFQSNYFIIEPVTFSSNILCPKIQCSIVFLICLCINFLRAGVLPNLTLLNHL
jgi:hypothetical protein